MHLNISSLLYHFNELSELLNDLIIKFKIIGITESRLRSEKSPLSYINFTNFLDEDVACGNLTCCTFDHLAQFMIYANKTQSDQNYKKI